MESGRPQGAGTLTGPSSLKLTSASARAAAGSVRRLGLARRSLLFALLFVAEWVPVAVYLHDGGHGAASLLEITVVFCSLLLAVGFTRYKDSFLQISSELESVSIGWGYLLAHFCAYAAFIWLSLRSTSTGLPGALPAVLWYAAGIGAIGLSGLAFVPLQLAWRLLRSTGFTWAFALTAAVIARLLTMGILGGYGAAGDSALAIISKPATDLTFGLVNALLRLLLPNVVTNWSTMTIGTPSFNVTILPWCAGLEGTALMLVFSVAWLGFFRKEYRFPNALLLIPAGMLVIWLSNAARITALVLIGVAGAPDVAVGGFHSQAGWIAFNCVALGFVLVSRRLPWVTVAGPQLPAADTTVPASNPTVAYLLPFLAIVASGMLSTAASGSFEWLYPLRFIAAAVALWSFRSTYSKLDWRFGWYSVLTGVVVLAMWLGLDRFSGASTNSSIGAGLAALPASARIAWLMVRTAAAVITVPIAEELVFRGFLIRRLISSNFDSLDPRRYTYVSLLISSVAFGLLHGDRWLAGTLAGLLYAIAYLRRGRIGDAVIAHATTNGLLAAWVLMGARWYLW